jgi:Flp pilus assembly protein TadB
MRALKYFYKIHPDRYKSKIDNYGNSARIDNHGRISVLISLFASSISIIIISIIPYGILTKMGILIVFLPFSYFWAPIAVLSAVAERRKKEVENLLPDALLLISNNLKSGSSMNQALLASARSEFGPLQKELEKTAIDISSGKTVQKSLNSLRSRTNSEIFADIIRVLISSMKSGGNAADLLNSSAKDVRNSLELRKKIRSSVRMYVIFIFMASVIGAPTLFSLTVYMSEMTTDMWSSDNLEASSNELRQTPSSSFRFQKPDINTDFLIQFSVASITITNFFSSLIIGFIRSGKLSGGIRILPITIPVSVVLFLLINTALSTIL